MAFTTKKAPTQGGGFLDRDAARDAVAVLLEIKDWSSKPSTEKVGRTDYRVVADVTIFGSEEALKAGTPTLIQKGVAITQTGLARDLEDYVGAAVVFKNITTRAMKNNPSQKAWVWGYADGDTEALVVQYGEAREAALAAAMESAPSFD